MRANKTSYERMQRVSAILAKRFSGKSLVEIGAEENPPVSPQAVQQLIGRALSAIPQQSTADIRILECGRLDAMTAVLWPAVLLGDIGAIDRVLAIMARRARLLGLDLQRPSLFSGHDGEEIDPQVIKVEIVGNPEIARVRWLKSERERLLALTGDASPTSSKVLN